MYHISDRADGRDGGDDDEDEGSESYPSRTRWGQLFSLGEKFPFLLETHWGIFAYNYFWGLTSAQIELGLADQPFVDYKTGKDKVKKHSRAEMDSLAERWRKAREESGGSMAAGWTKAKTEDILKQVQNTTKK